MSVSRLLYRSSWTICIPICSHGSRKTFKHYLKSPILRPCEVVNMSACMFGELTSLYTIKRPRLKLLWVKYFLKSYCYGPFLWAQYALGRGWPSYSIKNYCTCPTWWSKPHQGASLSTIGRYTWLTAKFVCVAQTSSEADFGDIFVDQRHWGLVVSLDSKSTSLPLWRTFKR